MTISWLEWFRATYPVLVTIVSLGALACVLWLGTKFAAKSTVEELARDRAMHETRLQLLEEANAAHPTRAQLSVEIMEMSGKIASINSALKGVGKQIDTTNSYLHTVIERALGGKL